MRGISKIAIEDPRDKLSNPQLFVIGMVAVTIFMIGASVLAPKILK